MNHHAFLNPRHGQFHPSCSCRRWTGRATRWQSDAVAQINVHLTAVGAPELKIASEQEVWARRYLGQRGGVA